jgi:hypothetical protein
MTDKKQEPFKVSTSLDLNNILKSKSSTREKIKASRKHKAQRIKKSFGHIEDIFAKNGVVYIIDNNGHQSHITPRQAFERCSAIHQMAVKMREAADLAEKDNAMSSRAKEMRQKAAITFHKMQRFLNVAKEAQYQLESGEDKAVGLFNLVTGKDYHSGKAVNVKDNLDSQLEFYKVSCFMLTEDEIVRILRAGEGKYTMKQLDQILTTEHGNRLVEYAETADLKDLPHFKPQEQ